MNKQPVVYILATPAYAGGNGALYVGVTSNLVKRVWEHRGNVVEGFTSRYGVHRLVYFEMCDDMEQAILRERRIKKWNRYKGFLPAAVAKTLPYAAISV